MIRIAVTPLAYDAIKATLPANANPKPVQRNAHGNYYIWIPDSVRNRLMALRSTGEGWSETIIRIAQL